MSNEIDIRKDKSLTPDRIRVFGASVEGEAVLDAVFKEDSGGVGVLDSEGWGGERLKIVSKEHALDVIKGIEKAIELGWFK